MSLGTIKCHCCDTPVEVKEGKRGSLSASCSHCGGQLLARSVKACAMLRVKLGKPETPPAIEPPKPHHTPPVKPPGKPKAADKSWFERL